MLGVLIAGLSVHAEDWPQWRGPTRAGVWDETGILERFPPDGLKIRWRIPVGPGYSSPVESQGRVYVIDCKLGPKEKRSAKECVRCLDAVSGRVLWTSCYDADYPDF